MDLRFSASQNRGTPVSTEEPGGQTLLKEAEFEVRRGLWVHTHPSICKDSTQETTTLKTPHMETSVKFPGKRAG